MTVTLGASGPGAGGAELHPVKHEQRTAVTRQHAEVIANRNMQVAFTLSAAAERKWASRYQARNTQLCRGCSAIRIQKGDNLARNTTFVVIPTPSKSKQIDPKATIFPGFAKSICTYCADGDRRGVEDFEQLPEGLVGPQTTPDGGTGKPQSPDAAHPALPLAHVK
jgi:hypothetical protein